MRNDLPVTGLVLILSASSHLLRLQLAQLDVLGDLLLHRDRVADLLLHSLGATIEVVTVRADINLLQTIFSFSTEIGRLNEKTLELGFGFASSLFKTVQEGNRGFGATCGQHKLLVVTSNHGRWPFRCLRHGHM